MKVKAGISIVIPTWNGKELLKRNLPSLIEAIKYYGEEYEIILVDDASTDGSSDFISRTYPFIKVTRSEKRQGFPVSANRGVMESKHALVLLLNTDMSVDRDFLSPLLHYFDDDTTFAVSSTTLAPSGGNLTRAHVMEFKYGFLREVYIPDDRPSFAFGASGGHALFSREKFIQLGGFDDIYSPFYYEDADLSYRAWKRGYRIYYEPRSIVYHKHQATIGKAFSKSYIRFISNRNKLIFLWGNLTDSNFLLQHFLFLPFYLLGNIARNPLLFLSFLAALKKLPSILIARKKEKRFILFGDKSVLRLIREEVR